MLSLLTTYLLSVVYSEIIRIFEFLVFQIKVIIMWRKMEQENFEKQY
jgi:hypothetical protein